MKRFVNFRPLLLIFIFFVSTIYCVIKSFLNDFVPLIILCSVLFLILILFIISFFKKDNLTNFCSIFSIKNLKIFCLIIICSSIIASIFVVINFLHFSKRELNNGTYTVSADVKEVVKLGEKTRLLLNHISINNQNYSFHIQASVESDDFAVGDRIEFSAYIYATKLVQNYSINTTILKNNLQYYCSINLSTLKKSVGNASFVDILKDRTKTLLFENMIKDNAGLSYAVICGDKSLLSNAYYEIFNNAGLMHILAVSGLHVGVLVAIISFILKKLKVKAKVRFIAICSILLIYNILCGFAPSVFRASVMSLCLILGMILGERNDTLSNISLAGIVVLIFQPLFLFDVGFLLSFGAVFGIVLLSKFFDKLFEKLRFPKILASSFSLTISATLGILPWVGKFFYKLVPFSIFSNLIILPLFSVMFVILLITVALSLTFSIPILLVVAEFFVNIVVNWSAVFANFGSIAVLNFDLISILAYYVILFFASPYFMMSLKSKLICILTIMLSFSTLLANSNTPILVKNNSISTNGNLTNSLILTTKAGNTILSNIDNDDYAVNNIIKMLQKKKIRKLDYILIFNYIDEMQTKVSTIAKNYNTQEIYVFGEYSNSTKIGLVNNLYSNNGVHFVEDNKLQLSHCDFEVECYNNNQKTKAVKYLMDNKSTLQILYSVLFFDYFEIYEDKIIYKDIFGFKCILNSKELCGYNSHSRLSP